MMYAKKTCELESEGWGFNFLNKVYVCGSR